MHHLFQKKYFNDLRKLFILLFSLSSDLYYENYSPEESLDGLEGLWPTG